MLLQCHKQDSSEDSLSGEAHLRVNTGLAGKGAAGRRGCSDRWRGQWPAWRKAPWRACGRTPGSMAGPSQQPGEHPLNSGFNQKEVEYCLGHLAAGGCFQGWLIQPFLREPLKSRPWRPPLCHPEMEPQSQPSFPPRKPPKAEGQGGREEGGRVCFLDICSSISL